MSNKIIKNLIKNILFINIIEMVVVKADPADFHSITGNRNFERYFYMALTKTRQWNVTKKAENIMRKNIIWKTKNIKN